MKRFLPFVLIAYLITAIVIFPAVPTAYLNKADAGSPTLLSFDELLALYENETPPEHLVKRLEEFLDKQVKTTL